MNREEERRQFTLEGLRRLGGVMWDIIQPREKGDIVPYDPDEILEDNLPHVSVPGQVVLGKREIDPPSPRLRAILDSVRLHNIKSGIEAHKRVVITGAGVGVVILTIGTVLVVKRYIDNNPRSDITDK